ncbi:MAG: PaaI family thioesterase [Porticoccaceae bacterium]
MTTPLAMNVAQLGEFLKQEFPQTSIVIDDVGEGWIKVRQAIELKHLRPGNTVSGPSLMAVADVALYLAILAIKGPVALAVTTNLNINFLRKPAADKDIVGDCRLIKVGKRLVVGEVFIYSDGDLEAVAHVTATYSIPSG